MPELTDRPRILPLRVIRNTWLDITVRVRVLREVDGVLWGIPEHLPIDAPAQPFRFPPWKLEEVPE